MNSELIKRIFSAGYAKGCEATEGGCQTHSEEAALEWAESEEGKALINQLKD